MLIILLIALSLAGAAPKTNDGFIDVYAKQGTDLRMQSHYAPPDVITHIAWYLDVFQGIFDTTIPSYFTGVKLCESSPHQEQEWFHPPLNFHCINNSLYLYHLKPSDAGVYNAKVFSDSIEHNTYYRLHVISFPKPNCNINSTYLANDYCLINIDCSKLSYPAKVYFNGNQSKLHYYLSARGGGGNLPDYFTVGYQYRDLKQNYTVHYPFNDLCAEITALETGADFTPIFLITLVVSAIVMVLGIAYLIYHCRTLKTKKPKPPEIRLL